MNAIVNPLNQGQQSAADAFFSFLFDENQKEFIISGPAGVGKTFLMSFMIDQIMPRYLEMCRLMGVESAYEDVVMCATTNKAAEVLAQATRRPTSTVHSFLALKPANDYSDGSKSLQRRRDWKIHTRKIIFIDECSMIDTELWKAINDATMNCKIVYVGDHNQLAPVKETLSPIYNQKSPFFELTQPMRNAGNQALMAICQQLRETVQTGVFRPIQLVPGSIDHLIDSDMELGMEMVFKDPDNSSRILAYTNKRVMDYNDHIRWVRALPSAFQPGEFLVNNQAIQLKEAMLSVEAGVEVLAYHGSSMVEIDRVNGQKIELEVNTYELQATSCGQVYRNVMAPVDREHFNELTRYYKRQHVWSKYYHLQETFADLRPRDAATVHKAQGSTYDSVFIDLANISTCHNPDQAARMLYVAFSRARNRVYLYGDLVGKYGGLVS